MTYPKTIDELRMWAEDNNLPLDEMRTYIGIDYREQRHLEFMRMNKLVSLLFIKIKQMVHVQSDMRATIRHTR